jgi:hypothetical protein
VEAEDVVGRWRLVRTRAEDRDHAVELTPSGDLVMSYFEPGGIARILLTYELDGHVLVSDRPSAPREERTSIVIDLDGRMMLGEAAHAAWYVREPADAPSDVDALPLAIAGRALRHAVATAQGEAFIPFVMWFEGKAMRLDLLMASTPADAERSARARIGGLPAATAAFVYDGFLTVDGTRTDAAFCKVSRRAPPRGLVVAQAYRPGPDGAVPIGALCAVDASDDSWLR